MRCLEIGVGHSTGWVTGYAPGVIGPDDVYVGIDFLNDARKKPFPGSVSLSEKRRIAESADGDSAVSINFATATGVHLPFPDSVF